MYCKVTILIGDFAGYDAAKVEKQSLNPGYTNRAKRVGGYGFGHGLDQQPPFDASISLARPPKRRRVTGKCSNAVTEVASIAGPHHTANV